VIHHTCGIGTHAEKEGLSQGDHPALAQEIPTDGQENKDGHGEKDLLPIDVQSKWEYQQTHDGQQSWC